ncbi:MAG: cysteine--tRNA ligase [Alphaproteobacteria bacterium]|jgi:cysteinyl-tRNA synthetase|nr:cysteine--tRNA ligase [Alphaproteobacteria bacterium]
MTQLHLYNTLSRQKELFEPIDPAHVRMYVCGPTVYDYAHIGNARPVVVFDTLYRLLKRHFPKVSYARNITDVDDKILARAAERKISIKELTVKTTQIFHEDMDHLNALRPDHEPRATAYIAQMIALTQTLIEKGHAYEAEGHVLFDVASMPTYGKLSRRTRDELIAGARVEVAPYKKDPADFVLWKPAPEGGEGWDSPWGYGRPGWHLECSAMADDLLGTTFDIHGGGLDLIFPHHENEIAQSSCAHDGAPPAKYWVHNGFLTVNGEKMSKSLGNFFTVHELLDEAPGEALRLTLLSAHYRQPCDFTKDGLMTAKATLDKWYSALRSVADIEAVRTDVPAAVEDALLDDMNTPLAIAAIHEIVSNLNKATDNTQKAKLKGELLAAAQAVGLLEQEAESWLKGAGSEGGPSEAEIEAKIAERLAARKAKNFALSDEIRDTLAAQGVILEDGPQGTTWRRG